MRHCCKAARNLVSHRGCSQWEITLNRRGCWKSTPPQNQLQSGLQLEFNRCFLRNQLFSAWNYDVGEIQGGVVVPFSWRWRWNNDGCSAFLFLYNGGRGLVLHAALGFFPLLILINLFDILNLFIVFKKVLSQIVIHVLPSHQFGHSCFKIINLVLIYYFGHQCCLSILVNKKFMGNFI